ncbi:MAG: FKBP-type peptidyl-prolyl cis-trans isomerase [Candidatus Bathyarchaeia archaeon]
MPVAKGDFILLDYTMRIKETGELFDTTSEEEAKKAGVYKEGSRYEPILIIVGEGWVLKGLDDSLVGLDVGKEQHIEIPPAIGFGERDPSKIRMIPITRFRRHGGGHISPGMEVEVDGKHGLVRAVGGGRVQVDFNPPLAGKTLVYNVNVKEILIGDLEKVKALIHRRIPEISIDKFRIGLSEKEVQIDLPSEAYNIEGIQTAIRGLSSDILRFLPAVEKVVFTQVFFKEKKESSPPA